MSKVIVIGGGAAGMMAAVFAARNGHEVILYEKNEKLGKKLYITGKGRCNITNACDMDVLFDSVCSNNKFLYSAFYSFTNQDVIDFFEEAGLKTKVERGGRVFPLSDKSSDVIQTFLRLLKKYGVKVHFHAKVDEVIIEDNTWKGIRLEGEDKIITGDRLIVATGGLSYPSTGSTGDGYRFAEKMGHTITDLSPSLVPFELEEPEALSMQGLSLKNIEISIQNGKKELYREFGEMLFTHFGVSGPVILSGSAYVVSHIKKGKKLTLTIDLKPALTKEQLDQRICREFEGMKNKQFKNTLDSLLPKKLIPVVIKYSQIDPEKKVHSITREERNGLVNILKGMIFHISGIRGYNEAIITKGGIKVSEINPSTMESKKVANVHFIGEALDLDAVTGGFNLQIAWSTAYAAANGMDV